MRVKDACKVFTGISPPLKKCHLKVLSIFSFGMVKRHVGWIAADFYPFPFKNSPCSASAFYALSHSVSKCSHAFCHAQEWQANDISRATLRLARPNGAKNNGAKMTSDSRQKFPERGKTNQNHTPPLQLLDCFRFDPKRRIWAAFQFPGTRNKWMYYSTWNDWGRQLM